MIPWYAYWMCMILIYQYVYYTKNEYYTLKIKYML